MRRPTVAELKVAIVVFVRDWVALWGPEGFDACPIAELVPWLRAEHGLNARRGDALLRDLVVEGRLVRTSTRPYAYTVGVDALEVAA